MADIIFTITFLLLTLTLVANTLVIDATYVVDHETKELLKNSIHLVHTPKSKRIKRWTFILAIEDWVVEVILSVQKWR